MRRLMLLSVAVLALGSRPGAARATFPDSTTAYRKLVSALNDAGGSREKPSRRLKGRSRED